MEDKVLMPKELTAENGAKKLMIGEFKEKIIMPCQDCDGEGILDAYDGSTCPECGGAGNFSVSVSGQWPTIKAIYAVAVENLSLPEPPKDDKEIARLRKALEFYADKNNYEQRTFKDRDADYVYYSCYVAVEEGEIARKALGETNGQD